MGDLTQNFSRWEFECPCCGNAPISLELVDLLQSIRDEVGPMHINSGYRCLAHNRTLPDSSDSSQHVLGLACDIRTPGYFYKNGPVSPRRAVETFADFILNFAGIGGLGVYSWGVHADLRRGDTLITWGF